MACLACGSPVQQGDNYCRECGRPQESRLLPAPIPRRAVARRPAPLPPLLLGGVAALLAGKAARWALREIASGMVKRMLRPGPPVPSGVTARQHQEAALPPGSRVVTRVWWHTEVYVPPTPQRRRRRLPFGLR